MITIPCILCLVYWCLTTSLWIYLQRPQKTQQKHIRSIFSQNPGWYNSLVQRIYAGFYMEKKKCLYKEDNKFTSLHRNRKIKKISVWYLIYRKWWGRYWKEKKQSKCTILTKYTAILDMMSHNYFKDSFLDDVRCENCSSGGSESIKPWLTV